MSVKFNTADRPEFYKVLNKRVQQYFKQNKISKHANLNMKVKTAFMISLYLVPFAFILLGGIQNAWIHILLWSIMGFGASGIGLSVMHDANHGSYSKNKKVNRFLGLVLNFIGGYHTTWKLQHNVLHHSFTNIHGHDEDLHDGSILRMSPNQEPGKKFRFQAFYAPFFYSIMTLYWITAKDFVQMKRYHKEGVLKENGVDYGSTIFKILLSKSFYFIFTLVLPILFAPVAWYITLTGFILMHLILGIVLALIFQPAHVIEETDFFLKNEGGSVENSWAIHQLLTTSNFAQKSRAFSWFVGGLNYQIEHHLFPHICHVHYRKISSIVKSTADEFNIPYHQHSTFYGALKSHFSLLHQLGTGEYDRKMLAAS